MLVYVSVMTNVQYLTPQIVVGRGQKRQRSRTVQSMVDIPCTAFGSFGRRSMFIHETVIYMTAVVVPRTPL